MNESRFRRANVLALQWHAGALTTAFEAFQAWCLASLRSRLRHDGAIWGVLDDPELSSGRRISSAHLYRIDAMALDDFERLHDAELTTKLAPGGVGNRCLAGAAWDGPAHAELREHARRYGMPNALLTRSAFRDAPAQQLLVLTRKLPDHPFSADEVALFEYVAPHMMQAFATCRKLVLDSPQAAMRRPAGFASALIDRAGVVLDQHVRFVPMMQREWSDWPGQRLPKPLLDLTARRVGTRWRFIGTQVSAEFLPVDDLYLVTVRPRHVGESLTTREKEVALHFADGASFREIAEALELRPATVRSHLRNVYSKLQIRNKSQLAAALR